MLKKTITYTDYNGEPQTEVFHFNLNKAELMEMQLIQEGGMKAFLEKIVETKDAPKLVEMFKKIILLSYGEKSDDGKHFIKSEELRRKFECSEAYSELFIELATNSDSAAEFINGLLPSDMQQSQKALKAAKKELTE